MRGHHIANMLGAILAGIEIEFTLEAALRIRRF